MTSLILFSSCGNINSNILFKIPRGEVFKYDSIPLIPEEDFKLAPGDRFSFIFGTNKGEMIVLSQSGVNNSEVNNGESFNFQIQNRQNLLTYLVRQDGTVNLPVIGVIHVSGKTIVELEDEIQKLLSENYINPFVQIRVTNQRVIIFPGKGDAEVVSITN